MPGPPSSVDIAPKSDTSVTVNWTPPEELNGKLTGFTISWGEINPEIDSRDNPVTVPANNTNYEVTNLIACHPYQFVVTAMTAVGKGPSKNATGSPSASGKTFIIVQL